MKTQLNFFADETDVMTVVAGETIFQEGDSGEVMYGIQAGTVDIVYKERVLETVGPGGIFGEMALVDHEPRSATVIAKTDCRLVVIDEAHFLMFIQHNPLFALFVFQTMTERVRRETQR